MSESIPLEICDAIREIMLEDTDLDGLEVIYRGVPNVVPVQYRTFAMIVVTGDAEAQPLTGGAAVRAYEGVISLFVRGQDQPVPSGRAANVASYDSVVDLVETVKRIFKPTDNDISTLNGLLDDDDAWAVVGFFIADAGDVVYGYSDLEERENNYENYAVIPFICAVQE